MQWIARDSNGNLIRQFDEAGEHHIPELDNRKIISVGYWDEMKDEWYLCSLITGIFYFPDKRVETNKDIGGREFILERRHAIAGNIHDIRYIFGFKKDGKRWISDTKERIVEIG